MESWQKLNAQIRNHLELIYQQTEDYQNGTIDFDQLVNKTLFIMAIKYFYLILIYKILPLWM